MAAGITHEKVTASHVSWSCILRWLGDHTDRWKPPSAAPDGRSGYGVGMTRSTRALPKAKRVKALTTNASPMKAIAEEVSTRDISPFRRD